MKKILFTISVTCMVLGCHKKETAKLANELANYFEKAQNNTLPVEQRITFNNKALELVLQSENKEDSLFFKRLFKVANTYYNSKEWETYKTITQRIITYARQGKDYANLAKGYEYLGDYYKEQEVKDSTYCYYLKAEKEYVRIQDKESIGRMLLEKATIQYYDGDLNLSEISCLQALKIFNDLKNNDQDKRNIWDAYNLLGIISNDQEEYNKAIDYYNKSLEVIKKDATIINKDLLEINSLNNLGVAYRNKNENKEAMSYFTRALETKELPEKAPHLYAMLLDNTAYSHFKLKDDTGVEDLFYKALRIRETLNIASGIVMSKVHMSEYYHLQKDIKKAFAFADEAYKTAKTKGTDPRNVMLTLRQLQTVNAPLKEAYAIEYNRIADSLQQAQSKIHQAISQQLTQAEAKEEAEMKKKEKLKTALIELGVIVCFLGVNYVLHRRNKIREDKLAGRVTKLRIELQDLVRENQANILEKQQELEEKEKELEEKEAQKKIYDLLVDQKTKAKTRLNQQRFSIVQKFHKELKHNLLSQRLFLETLKDTKEPLYYHHLNHLKTLEKEVHVFYDFCNEVFQDAQESEQAHFRSLLYKLFNQQRKYTTVTEYIDQNIKWDQQENVFKMHLYYIIKSCFEVINQHKHITYVDIEMYDDDDEQKKDVLQFYITCNGVLKIEALQEVSNYVRKIKGILRLDPNVEEGNTKIDLFFATATSEL